MGKRKASGEVSSADVDDASKGSSSTKKSTKRRGLSFDEKRERLLELYAETKDVFQLKELEKLASKRKKIVLNTVKDVNQSLIDDSLIESDRIGTSNYFWAFPSAAQHRRDERLRRAREATQRAREECAEIDEQRADLSSARIDNEERRTAEKDVKSLRAQASAKKNDLRNYRQLDPERYRAMQREIDAAKLEGNTSVDNLYTVLKWLRDRCPHLSHEQLCAQFGIGEDDLEYIE